MPTVVEPTYTSQGYTLHKCTCGDSYKDNYKAKLTVSTPTNFKMSGNTAISITLSWDKVSEANGYIIEEYVGGGVWERVVKISNNATTQYTIGSLANATEYKYRIKTYKFVDSATYYSSYSDTLTAVTKPAKVIGKMTANTPTTITLGWDITEGADGYIIEEHVGGGVWERVSKISNGTTTQYKITGLANGSTHKYRIKSYKFLGTVAYFGAYSDTITAVTKPAKVTGKMTTNSASSLTLSWDKVTGADGYIIEEYVGNGEWTRVKKISDGSTTQYAVTGLTSGTTHKYRIKSYKFYGTVAYFGAYSDTITAITKPGQVTAKVEAVSSSSIRLGWDKITGADGYIIEKYVGNGEWERVAKVSSGDTTQYSVTGLSGKTKYSFRIKAYKFLDTVAYFGTYSANVSGTTK